MYFVAREVAQCMRVIAQFPDYDKVRMRSWMALYHAQYPAVQLWVNHTPDEEVRKWRNDLNARVVDAGTLIGMDSAPSDQFFPCLYPGFVAPAKKKRASRK